MSQIFHRSTNAIAKFSIFGAVFLAGGGLWLLLELDRSSLVTRQDLVLKQPIPFSHEHHVEAMGISCLYCHTSVTESRFAGIPPTATCMNCHKTIWNQAPMLEPVRSSFATGESIEWRRVYDLPDFVYFDHSVHVASGIGCATCHGRVDQMPVLRKAVSLKMEWCIDCHDDPAKYVRPREEVFNMAWSAEDQEALGARLVEEYDIEGLTSCSTCHR